MSTTFNISSVLLAISSLENQLAALKAQLGAAPAAATATASVSSAGKKAKKVKKVKDPNAPKPERSSWGAFTDRVRLLLQSNGYTGKAVATECVQFCADLKKENPDFSAWKDEDILSRRTSWTKPEVSKQKASGNQWRDGKKVKVADSDIEDIAVAAAAAAGTTSSSGSVISATSSVKEKKPRKPRASASVVSAASEAVSATSSVKEKKARKPRVATETTAASAALVPLPPSPPASVAPIVPLKKVIIGKIKYLVHLDSGHAWHYAEDESGKAAKGVWAGLFSAPSVTGAGQKINAKVDSSVPDPNESE